MTSGREASNVGVGKRINNPATLHSYARDSLKVQVSAGCYLPSATRDILIRGAFMRRVGDALCVGDLLFID